MNGLGLDGDLHALATYIVWTLDVTVIDLPNFFFSMFVSALHRLRLNSLLTKERRQTRSGVLALLDFFGATTVPILQRRPKTMLLVLAATLSFALLQ